MSSSGGGTIILASIKTSDLGECKKVEITESDWEAIIDALQDSGLKQKLEGLLKD